MSNLNVKPRTLFWRENLEVLRGTNSESVDLIYLDPPTRRESKAPMPFPIMAKQVEFTGIFNKKAIKNKWIETIRFEAPRLYDYLMDEVADNSYYCYLVYMAIRLIECKRVLKKTGCIYLHRKHNKKDDLGRAIDLIFGHDNFCKEIAWKQNVPTNYEAATGKFTPHYDTLLLYAKSKHLHEQRQKYRKDTKAAEVWDDIPPVRYFAKDHTGHLGQRPLALLERIIKRSSKVGDVVLDPFCGSGTTCIAAERVQRKWMGIDADLNTFEYVKQRLGYEIPADLANIEEPEYTARLPVRNKKDAPQLASVYVISNDTWKGKYSVGITKDPSYVLEQHQSLDPNRGYKMEYCLETPNFREIKKQVHSKFPRRYSWVTADVKSVVNEINAIIISSIVDPNKNQPFISCNAARVVPVPRRWQ